MKFLHGILLSILLLLTNKSVYSSTVNNHRKELRQTFHGYEIDNIRLHLKLDGKNLSTVSTTHQQFEAPDNNKTCIVHPTTKIGILSYNQQQYIQFLKDVNGTQFYVGHHDLQKQNDSKFITFPFRISIAQYYCGVLHEYCVNSLMFMRCVISLLL